MEIEKECTRTKSYPWIPFDVTIQILSRLPGKSVVRFRCVSKVWSSSTTTPHFIKSFEVHSSARPSLLLVEKKEDKRIFWSLPHRQDPQRRYTPVEKFEMMLPKQDPEFVRGKVFSSIRGLICFSEADQVVIWNPTLRQHVVLPNPKLQGPLVSFLGYDPIGDIYKVVCMPDSKMCSWGEENPKVLTLGAEESWRIAEHHVSRRRGCLRSDGVRCVYGGICLNGIIYYYREGNDYDTLESFDVRSEEFKEIRKPDHASKQVAPPGYSVLTSYHGRLAWLSISSGESWVLTDPERQEWSKGGFSIPDSSIVPRRDGPYNDTVMQFGGVNDHEEIISMEAPRSRPFHAFYGDWKKKTTRWVAYQGLTDCTCKCDSFPNHIENLLSLANLFA